jgi:carbon storage regulator CsrA
MLVLSRKPLEAVVVGGARGVPRLLKVIVLEIRGQHVRLGFEADADLPVNRWEVWEQICAADGPVEPTQAPAAPVA